MAVSGRARRRFAQIVEEFGAGGRTRTDDLLITNQLLYQLSYAGRQEGTPEQPRRGKHLSLTHLTRTASLQERGPTRPQPPYNSAMGDLPICCSLTAAERDVRRHQLLPGLLARSSEHAETPDGYRFRFDSTPDVLAAILHVVDQERRCCRFLRFTLTLEPDLGPIWLEVSGAAGTRDFLADLLAPSR